MLLRMKKANRNKVLAFVVLLVFMLQSMGVPISFAEEVNLKVTEMTTTIGGELVDNYDFVANPIQTSTKVKIAWKFDVLQEVTTDGAIGFLPLPEGLDFSPFSGWTQATGFQYQYDSSTKKMALKFPKGVEENTPGNLELDFSFNLDTSQTQTEYTYTFPLSDGSTKEVTIKFKPDIPTGQNASIHKYQGAPLKNGTVIADGFNADGVRWQIDVNKGLDTITAGSVLEDTFTTANLKLKAGTLKVEGLNIALDGSDTVDTATTLAETTDYTLTDKDTGGFDLTFVKESARAYRITYDTDIADTSLATTLNFKNRASFGGNSSEATASTSRAETLEKTGELYREGAVATDGVNPDSIRWTVTVNKSESNITNASLKDILPAGLAAPAATDIQVKQYELNNGAIDDSTGVSVTVTPTISGSNIDIPLGNINKTHVITFTTKITDFTKTAFTNKAELYGNSQATALLSIEKTVDNIIHGAMLEKDGKTFANYGNQGYIDWTVDVNQSQRPMKDGAVIIDNLPLGLELDTSSIKVNELTIAKGSSGVTATVGANVSAFTDASTAGDAANKPTLTLTFTSPGKKAYRIAYRTKILDPTQTSFKNEVSVTGGWDGVDTLTKAVTKSIDNSVRKYQGTNGINYTAKTMDWTLVATPARAPMKNLVITDTYPNKGLRFKTDSLVVTSNGNPLTKDTDYTFALTYETPGDTSSAETGFEIRLIGSYGTLTHPLTVQYTTDFDRIYHANYPGGNTDLYKNSAKFDWTEGTDPTIMTKTANHEYSVSTTPSSANASKWGEILGDRRDRTLQWYVDVNYLGNSLDPFSVSDAINKGQELVVDSIQVFGYTRQSDGSIVYDATAVSPSDKIYSISKADSSSFEIGFGKINKPYSVQFKTKLKGETQASYNNTATVDGKSITAKQTISYADIYDKFVEKNGKQLTGVNAYSIEWKAKLNTSLSEIQNAKILDSLSAYQEYDPDSFKLYKMTAGNTKTPVNPSEYTLVFSASDGKQSFVLHLDNDINDGKAVTIQDEYLLEYTSIVTKKEAITISNDIFLEGEGFRKGNQTVSASTFTFNVNSTGSLGVPPLKTGTVNIVKTDADATTPLKDVTFQLLKKSDQSVMDEKMTDTAGKLTFSSLPYGDYILREKVPAGYQTVADKEFTVAKTSLTFDYSIANYKTRSIEVTKVDKSDPTKKLKGAVFMLKDSDGKQIGNSVTTDDLGVATLTGLGFGDYTLVEISPPTGYDLAENTLIPIKGNDPTIVHKVAVSDVKTPTTGILTVKKKDKDTDKLLSGVIFEIWSPSNTKVAEITTNDDGVAILKDLPFGNYTLKEQVPAGYLPVKDIDFSLSLAKQTQLLEIDNYKVRSIKVIKEDERNSSIKLSGATFSLTDAKGTIISEKTTDNNGVAIFDNLDFESYTLREVTPPRGYYLNRQTEVVTINKDKMLYEILFKNRKRSSGSSTDPEPPFTGGMGGGGGTPPTPIDPTKPVTPPTVPPVVTPVTPPTVPPVVTPVTPAIPPTDTVDTTTTVDKPADGLITIEEGDIPLVTLPPKNGTVIIDDKGKWTYTPDPGFKGKDKFVVTITHPDGTTEDILVEIDVEDIPAGTPIIDSNSASKNKKALPATSGVPTEYFYGTGILALLSALLLKKKQ